MKKIDERCPWGNRPYKHHMSIRAFCNIIWTFRPHESPQIMTVCRVDWVGMLGLISELDGTEVEVAR